MKWVKLFLLTAGNIKAQWDTGLQTCPLEGFFFCQMIKKSLIEILEQQSF